MINTEQKFTVDQESVTWRSLPPSAPSAVSEYAGASRSETCRLSRPTWLAQGLYWWRKTFRCDHYHRWKKEEREEKIKRKPRPDTPYILNCDTRNWYNVALLCFVISLKLALTKQSDGKYKLVFFLKRARKEILQSDWLLARPEWNCRVG